MPLGAVGSDAEVLPIGAGGDLGMRRAALAREFEHCRTATLQVFSGVDEELFRERVDPAFSPVGWHLGHIARTEAQWLLTGDSVPLTDGEAGIFAVDTPKTGRTALPSRERTLDYCARVRRRWRERLDDPACVVDDALARFVLQHEAQHAETVQMLLSLARHRSAAILAGDSEPIDYVSVEGGRAAIGSEQPEALDNERDLHIVEVAPFRLARHPVTQTQFAAFIAAGGYRRSELWSTAGWSWRQSEGEALLPLHWNPALPLQPVCGINAYEAEAFCRWADARLPSEFEWEWAASRERRHRFAQMLGTVWQWTSSTFVPYPGFAPWPYRGYSEQWFDGKHRVLRGGSAATLGYVLRPSFRNWYAPHVRQVFAGLRCARDHA
jgi:ergothioneine biosynthesis protein EgtB